MVKTAARQRPQGSILDFQVALLAATLLEDGVERGEDFFSQGFGGRWLAGPGDEQASTPSRRSFGSTGRGFFQRRGAAGSFICSKNYSSGLHFLAARLRGGRAGSDD